MLTMIKEAIDLPTTFALLMSLTILIYAVLDGYDLGVGILTKKANAYEKELMIGSIGPFWDANETWLILAIGLLLVAFPAAHGIILHHLYFSVALMLAGLIFRGVAFDFRAKVPSHQKQKWDNTFFYGSMLTALSQGYMLGQYINGFDQSLIGLCFSYSIAASVAVAYALIGASWLIMKCEGELQKKAILWSKQLLPWVSCALIWISVATPLFVKYIHAKWFSMTALFTLVPMPIITGMIILVLHKLLPHMPFRKDRYCWLPFSLVTMIYLLGYIGLIYSIFPYIIPEKMLITDAASASESLELILIGALILIPCLITYTALSYRIFHGKASELRYD